MIRKYHFTLLLISLFTLTSLQSMETESSETTTKELYDALEKGDINSVKSIVEKTNILFKEVNPHADRNEYVMIGKAIKGNATEQGKLDLIFFLLKYGVKPKYQDLFDTFIHIKDNTSKEQVIHALLACGTPLDLGGNTNYKTDTTTADSADSLLQYLENTNTGNLDDLIEIVKKHIHTRLFIAIKDDATDETRRLIEKYTININESLPYYGICYNNSAKHCYKQDSLEKENIVSGLPLHHAIEWNSKPIICMLVKDLGAKANLKNDQGKTIFEYYYLPTLDVETAQILLDHGAPCDYGEYSSTNVTRRIQGELQNSRFNDKQRANLNTLNEFFNAHKTKNALTQDTNNLKPAPQQNPQQNDNNPQTPVIVEPDNDPTNQTNVITKSVLPWKLIGGGVVIVAAIVAGKKLYNWYYAKTEDEKEKAEAEETSASAENAAAA